MVPHIYVYGSISIFSQKSFRICLVVAYDGSRLLPSFSLMLYFCASSPLFSWQYNNIRFLRNIGCARLHMSLGSEAHLSSVIGYITRRGMHQMSLGHRLLLASTSSFGARACQGVTDRQVSGRKIILIPLGVYVYRWISIPTPTRPLSEDRYD